MAKPIVSATIICDNIYRDSSTQKCVLSGTFATITSFKYPVIHGHSGIYIAVTDISECGVVQVVFRSEPEHEVIVALPGWRIEKIPEDRTETIELCGNIAGLPIPKEGVYEFAVFWNDSFVSSKRITAKMITINK